MGTWMGIYSIYYVKSMKLAIVDGTTNKQPKTFLSFEYICHIQTMCQALSHVLGVQ